MVPVDISNAADDSAQTLHLRFRPILLLLCRCCCVSRSQLALKWGVLSRLSKRQLLRHNSHSDKNADEQPILNKLNMFFCLKAVHPTHVCLGTDSNAAD